MSLKVEKILKDSRTRFLVHFALLLLQEETDKLIFAWFVQQAPTKKILKGPLDLEGQGGDQELGAQGKGRQLLLGVPILTLKE